MFSKIFKGGRDIARAPLGISLFTILPPAIKDQSSNFRGAIIKELLPIKNVVTYNTLVFFNSIIVGKNSSGSYIGILPNSCITYVG